MLLNLIFVLYSRDISFKENRISFMIMVVNKFSMSDLTELLANDPDKESKERRDIRDCLKEMIEQRVQLMERDKSMKSSKLLCRWVKVHTCIDLTI